MPPTVGVVAIQGDFSKHVEAIRSCSPDTKLFEIRTPEDLDQVTHLIIPGGESTTVGLLMQRYGLGEAIIKRVQQRSLAVWGTCMGMILLAKSVENHDQYRLGLLDITVRRNAFGTQVHSFEDETNIDGLDSPVMGVYIRAPIVTEWGPMVKILGKYQGQVVAARQENVLGTSFHPELTDDTRMHLWFLSFPVPES